MPLDKGKLQKLYSTLQKGGYSQSYDEFEKGFTGNDNYPNRKKVYDLLTEHGADIGNSYEDFMKKMYTPAASSPSPSYSQQRTQAPAPKPQPKPAPKPKPRPKPQPKGGGMTAAERAQFIKSAQDIVHHSAAGLQRVKNQIDYANSNRGLKVRPVHLGQNAKVVRRHANGTVAKPRPVFDVAPEQQPGDTYLTESGNEFTSRAEADTEQNAVDQYRYDQSETGQLNNAYAEADRLDKLLEQRGKELDAENQDKWWRDLPRGGGGAVSTMNANDNNGRMTDTEYLNLLAARKKVDEQIRDLKAARDEKTGTFLGGLWRGFRDYAFDPSNWDNGYRDLLTTSAMLRAKTGAAQTPREKASERMMMEDTYKAGVAAQKAEEALGNGYRWARITAQALPYGLQFMAGNAIGVTGGLARAGEGMGVKLARKIAIKEGANNLIRNFGRSVLKNTGVMLGDLGAATALSTTVQAAQTGADIGHRYAGDVAYDPKTDDYKLEGGKSLGRSIYEGVANSTIENYTEMLGEHMHLGKFASSALTKVGLGRVSNWFTKVGKTDFMQGVNKYMKMAGFNGYPQEVMEEEVGIPLHAIFDGGNKMSDLLDGRQQLDIVGGMLFSMAGMGGASMAMQGGHKAAMAVQYHQDQHKLDNADKVASFRLTADKWAPIKDEIDGTTNEDFGKTMKNVLSNDELSDQEKQAVWDYAQRLIIMRGHNMGQEAATRNGMTDKETNTANESYTQGYNTTDATAMNDAKNRLAAAQAKFDEAMKKEGVETWEGHPDMQDIQHRHHDADEVLNMKWADGSLIYEEGDPIRKLAQDVVNAQQEYEGMMQRVRDDIDDEVQQTSVMYDQRTNPHTGMIQSATLKAQNPDGTDKKVYITSGNIVMTDDGKSVDRQKSDMSVVVVDDEGKVQMISPEDIFSLDTPIDGAQAKQQAIDAIQQSKAQEAADKINGKVNLAAGNTYTLTDSTGQQIEATIVADGQTGAVQNPDGTVNVSMNGKVVPMDVNTLQQMVDNTNMQRAAQGDEEDTTGDAAAMQQPTEPGNTEQTDDEGGTVTPEGAAVPTYPGSVVAPDVQAPHEWQVDDTFVIDNGGVPVRGQVTGIDADGVEIYTESPVNGKKMQVVSPEELQSMTTEINGETVQGQEDAAAMQQPTQPVDGEQTGDNGSNGVNGEQPQGQAEPLSSQAEPQQTEGQQPQRAIDRIPSQQVDDGKGNVRTVHNWEQAEPGDTYDALTEIYHGNADRVKKGVQNRIGAIDKQIKSTQKQMDAIDNSDDFDAVAAQGEQYDQLQKQKEALEQQRKYWQSVQGVPQQRKLDEDKRTEEEKAAAKAAQEKAEAEAAEKARQEREQVNGVPDVVNDIPADARKRGFRNVNGMVVNRQGETEGVTGRESNVKFSSTDTAKGHIKVIDADQLQPSHVSGQRNPSFFIDEAQPKDRTDTVSSMAAAKIASNLNPEEITGDGSAYQFSAPTVNSRGEVIQGNNRSDALKLMYSTPAFKPAQDAYKQYISDHAEEFGFTPEDVAKIQQMQHPVMVNELGVDDDEAIRLGQMKASDNESGGIERIDPVTTSQKLGAKVGSYANILLSSPDEDASLSDVLMQNGAKTVHWLSSNGIISNTAAQSAFDRKGNLTPEARMDLLNILKQSLFQGGVSDLPTMFDKLPAKAQKAILNTFMRDFDSAESERILPEIQKAIEAWYGCAMSNEAFAKASNYKAAKAAMHDWTLQTNLLDDNMPSDKFSNFAMELACRLQGCSMREAQQSLNDFFDLVQGKSQGDLFGGTTMGEQADRQEAIRRVFDIDYKPINNKENGKTGSDAVADNGSQGGEGRQGSPADVKGRERAESGSGSADGTGGTESHDEEVDDRGDSSHRDYSIHSGDSLGATSSSEKKETERQGVNTEPSEKQKEAGNYKKGHIKVDGFDITIENPKGSTRSGKDASGKAWSVPMRYDYGYIKGTEGVDGDHIDVYLSDDPTKGNVYVVDQIDQQTGKFDEHKVMYGFPSKEAAVEAYKGQYEKGWKVGPVTEVSREDFKKWVESSKRKTKPFADYKIARTTVEKEQRPIGEPKRVSAKEAALRDGLRDVMREAGIEVIDDEKEGQRVLDMANDAQMSESKKRALETASPNLNGTDHQTVVSSTLGAKVIKDLDNLVNEYEFNKGNKPNTFIGDLSRALGAQKHGSNSEYATFETKNGRVVTIRLANHNAKVSTFDNHNESDGISIVITANNNSKLTNDGNAHVTEFYYNALKLRRAEGKPLADIVRSIKQALYSGEFKDTTGLAERQEVNPRDMARYHRVYHGSGAADKVKFFRTANGEAYGFTVGGKIYYDPRIATSETPIHEYTHLWAKALRKANPKEWANVVELMKGTWAWDHVRKLYPELETDDEIAEEALAHFSGKRGAENARKAMEEAMGEDRDGGLKEAAKRGLARLREALSKFWKNVCDLLHVHFTTAEEVADKVMYDLLNKVNPNTFNLSKPVEEGKDGSIKDAPTTAAEAGKAERAEIERKAKEDGTWMKAPNGQESNLSEDQWVTVRTKQFKDWFGDWEEDPEESSQAVDENGEPKVFYHNTDNDFTVFDANRNGTHTDAGWLGDGFYFYGDENEGDSYGHKKMEVFLNVRNMYYATSTENEELANANDREKSIAFRNEIEDEGYDGVYYNGDLRQEAVVFYPEQIKSATDNVGTYDAANPDIRYEKRTDRGYSTDSVEAANQRFNEELQEQIDGQQEPGHIYQLGRPSSVLLSTGIPDLPIQLSATRLKDKATSFGHDYALEDVKGLVNALQHPLAVFAYGNKEKAQNVIVELEKDGKNFIVGLSLRPVVNGRVLEINSIRNVFPKNNSEWLNWISQGKALYIDKKKVQDLIDKQRTILADVDYLDLNSVAKIVNDFENPVIKGENLSRESEDGSIKDAPTTAVETEEADVLYREVDDEEAARLDKEPTVKVYRAMQEHDGKLYPPMSGRVKTQVETKKGTMRTKWVWRSPIEIGKWEQSEEHPEMANEDGTFTLDKGNGSTINAAYNPYIHTSRTPINDQFSSAWNRPELVTVEVEVPVSELTSGYHAEKAKDATGEVEWKSGPVGREMAAQGNPRMVILSRWDKPVRIVPVDEVADEYAVRLAGTGIKVPFNTVPPALRDALVARGVEISEPEKGNAGQASRPSYEEWMKGNTRQREGNGAYTDEELSLINDPVAKWLGKSNRTKAQQKAFANRERRSMESTVKELADRLHLDNVNIVMDASTLDGRKARAKGFYDRNTNEITIVIPNHRDVEDVMQTLLHEGVAHYGLRKMFGSHFDTFLDNVYAAADNDVRRRITDLALRKYGGDFRVATEEYLASLAEQTDFERMPETFWQKIKRMFLAMLHDIGFEDFADTHAFTLSDNELRYILWRSYENLKEPGRYRSILGEAEDVAKQAELKVGDYSEAAAEPLQTERLTQKEREQKPNTAVMYGSARNSDYAATNDSAGEPEAWGKRDMLSRAEQVSHGIDPDLLFRDTIEDDDNTARETYNRMADEAKSRIREAWQDSMINVRNLQQAVLEQRGEKLEDYEDAYNAENRSHGKSRAESEYFTDNLYKPLLKAVDDVAKAAKVSVGDVTEYMMAKHGLERNIVFARRDADAAYKKAYDEAKGKYDALMNASRAESDPKKADALEKAANKVKFPDYDDIFNHLRMRDYAGLTSLTGQSDVQDAEAEAQRIVADMESRAINGANGSNGVNVGSPIDELWKATNAATKWTLKKGYESGIISKDNYNYVSGMFNYYVPLRGWQEDTAGDLFDYVGSGDKGTAFSPTLHKAKGRRSEADNPIAYIGSMAVSAIVQGNKNKVKQTFLGFVENHPTNLVTVSEMWYRNYGTDTAPDWREDVPNIPEDATADEVADIVQQHEDLMEQLKDLGKATKKRGRLHLGVPVKRGQALEHHVEVMVNGKKYVLYINGNPRAAQALNGTRQRRASERSFESSKIARMGRLLAERYTSLSPSFTVSNALRDLTMAAITTLIKESPAYALRFRLNVAKLGGPARMFTLMKWYKKAAAQQLPTGQMNETEKYFYEFMTEGAETGFTSLKEIDEYKKDMDKMYRNMNQKLLNPKRLFRGLSKGLEYANRCIEDMTRFAIYMASRQSGRNVKRSVNDAKNVTLNFNRKGSGELGNATYRNLQIFVNPAIQSLQNVGKMAKDHPVRFTLVTGYIALIGAAQVFATQLLWSVFGGGDGDDDDWNAVDEYWKLPSWQRRNNLVMWIPGTKKFAMIPLAQEFRVFHGFGETLTTTLQGKSDESPALELMSQTADLLPLDFAGNNGNMLVNLAPTVVQPLLQVRFNTDFTGRPLYKDTGFNKYEPSFQKAYVGTPSWLVKSSEFLNDLTGGDDHKQGWWERTNIGQYANNPAVVDHLLKGYYGGMYSFFAQTGGAMLTAASGKLPDVQEVPVANRVVTAVRETEQSGKQKLPDWYYELSEENARHQNEFSGYKKDYMTGDADGKKKFNALIKSKDFAKWQEVNTYIGAVQQIRTAMSYTKDPAEKAELQKNLDEVLAELKKLKDK